VRVIFGDVPDFPMITIGPSTPEIVASQALAPLHKNWPTISIASAFPAETRLAQSFHVVAEEAEHVALIGETRGKAIGAAILINARHASLARLSEVTALDKHLVLWDGFLRCRVLHVF
jgi:hypothetical protein